MRSMTGWGRGESENKNYKVTVDIKTLNHRYLDFQIRLPFNSPLIETKIREVSSEFLHRGKVDVTVSLHEKGEKACTIRLNRGMIKGYFKELDAIKKELGIRKEIGFDVIGSLPWGKTFEIEDPDLDENDLEVILEALSQALEGVVKMRDTEGEGIRKDLSQRIADLGEKVKSLEVLSEDLLASYSKRLEEKMRELAGGIELDESRIVQEAALLAERSDVTEEINRLKSHIVRMEKLVRSEGTVGKRYDFMLQETYREIHTVGSKMRGVDVSGLIVDFKAEIEKMREQVQNVE